MQKVQVLLQPTEIETQPAYVDSRRAGSVDHRDEVVDAQQRVEGRTPQQVDQRRGVRGAVQLDDEPLPGARAEQFDEHGAGARLRGTAGAAAYYAVTSDRPAQARSSP